MSAWIRAEGKLVEFSARLFQGNECESPYVPFHDDTIRNPKVVTLKGTVTDFQFINPHTLILFDVKNEKGEVEHWQAEATSPNHLVRAGWTRDIVKAGDQITISGYRAKNGTTIMRFQKMILANGQEVQEGGVDYR